MITYHFVITLASGTYHFGADGLHTVNPGTTRDQVYRDIVERTKRKASDEGIPTHRCATVFFALEPNEIGGDDA